MISSPRNPHSPRSPRGTGSRMSEARSPRVGKYMTVNRKSMVDDTLFDSPRGSGASSGSPRSPHYFKMTDIQKRFDPTEVGVITPRDIHKLKSIVQEEHNKEQLVAERAAALAHAAQRKAQLQALDIERERSQLTEFDKEKIESDNAVIRRAQMLLDQELEQVKKINSMALYAKCAAIREVQKIQNTIIKEEDRETEKMKDMQVELERLKGIKGVEDRENDKKAKRKKDMQVVIEQIRFKEQEQLMRLEEADREQEMMKEKVAQLQKQDIEDHQNLLLRRKQYFADCMKVNEQQLEYKRKQKERDRDEELRLLESMREKAKEEELAKLDLSKQVRRRNTEFVLTMDSAAQDKNNKVQQMENLRDKRSLEAYERTWRQRTMRDAEKAQAIREEVNRVRRQQIEEKHMGMVQAAMIERDEFERIRRTQEEAANREQEKEARMVKERMEHLRGLEKQIQANATAKQKARQEHLSADASYSHRYNQERQRLLALKMNTIDELQSIGVPAKYLAELERYKL